MAYSRLLTWVGLLIFSTGIFSAQEAGLNHTIHFGHNPGNLEMYSYSPAHLPDDNYPLVLVLHGCTQSAEEVALQTGWNRIADSLGFFVLYPQTKFANNVSKCFRWFSEKDIASDAGESASIHQMVKHFMQHHPVDSTEVFITGISAGGAMAVAMLARYPELFASGAIIAGGPFGAAWNIKGAKKSMRGKAEHTPGEWAGFVRSQNPGFTGTYPTISIYHGTKDKTVHPRNAEHLIAQWTHLHGAEFPPALFEENYNNQLHVQLKLFANSEGDSVVRYYSLHDVEHALSVAAGDAANQGGRAGRYSVDTGFHVPWQSAVDFGLTK